MHIYIIYILNTRSYSDEESSDPEESAPSGTAILYIFIHSLRRLKHAYYTHTHTHTGRTQMKSLRFVRSRQRRLNYLQMKALGQKTARGPPRLLGRIVVTRSLQMRRRRRNLQRMCWKLRWIKTCPTSLLPSLNLRHKAIYIYIYICMYVCMCIYICMYIYICI
jgi:hypothetical protein